MAIKNYEFFTHVQSDILLGRRLTRPICILTQVWLLRHYEKKVRKGRKIYTCMCDRTMRSRPIFTASFLLPKFQKIRDRVNT